MAVSRKRKHAIAEEQTPDKQPLGRKAQKDLKAFANIQKAPSLETGFKKRKTIHAREATPPAVIPITSAPAHTERKRKRSLDAIAEGSEDEIEVAQPKKQPSIFQQYAKTKTTATPQHKRFKDAFPPSPKETPSKNAAALFDKLKLDSAIPFALGQHQTSYDTPPDTPEAEKALLDLSLPAELQELCQLHASFLAALSLHYAHNGISSLVSLNVLLPQVTKTWKKRSVTTEDLRKLFAVGDVRDSAFKLEDVGRGKICLSRAQPRGRALKRAASYIDADELNERFEAALRREWLEWRASSSRPIATFCSQLPLLEVLENSSSEKVTPVFARGQQRLADLKAGQAAVRAEMARPSSNIVTEKTTAQAVQSRGTSLLDRVLAKQAVTSSLPAGPNKQQLERRAALHRVEEVDRVLNLLAGSKPRCSLSMPAMVQQLQQSLRNPISREEVERCLDLMAREITPGFVNVIVSGMVKGVVVNRSQKSSLEELRDRVARALV